MSQKPIDKRPKIATRDALWSAIRTLKTFTLNEVRRETCCSRGVTSDYLTGLVAAGLLSLESGSYTLVRDTGVDTPKVNRDGSDSLQGRGQLHMWTVLPILKEFSALDVAIHATTETVQVSELAAKDYLSHLYKAGYLAVSRKGRPTGKRGAGCLTRYRFLAFKYTGPKPPMVQRVKQVYDQNTGRVVWSQGGGHE